MRAEPRQDLGSAPTPVGSTPLSKTAKKRVTYAVEMARAACTKPELQDVYRRRFHRAMDALQSQEEGEAVYHRCRTEGWYLYAVAALTRSEGVTDAVATPKDSGGGR